MKLHSIICIILDQILQMDRQ